jgi:hypothetical protein
MFLIVSMFFVDSEGIWTLVSDIGKFILLDFHRYKEHPKWSPFVLWSTILVRSTPGFRIRL